MLIFSPCIMDVEKDFQESCDLGPIKTQMISKK